MSKINHIKFTLETDEDGDIYDLTFVDGQYIEEYCIDYEEISKGLLSPGEYEIFTCECGVAGCAGIYKGVSVRHESNLIVWEFTQPYEAQYIFEKEQIYKDLYKFIKKVENESLEVSSTLFSMSGAFRTLNNLKKLERANLA